MKHTDDAKREVLTMEEVERRFPDEWVLVEIVRDHRYHEKVQGRLIAHSPEREGIQEPFFRFKAARPDARTYQFFTGDVVPPGVTAVL